MHKLQVTNRMTCLCLVEREQPGTGRWAILEILCLSPCPHVLLLDHTEIQDNKLLKLFHSNCNHSVKVLNRQINRLDILFLSLDI